LFKHVTLFVYISSLTIIENGIVNQQKIVIDIIY